MYAMRLVYTALLSHLTGYASVLLSCWVSVSSYIYWIDRCWGGGYVYSYTAYTCTAILTYTF